MPTWDTRQSKLSIVDDIDMHVLQVMSSQSSYRRLSPVYIIALHLFRLRRLPFLDKYAWKAIIQLFFGQTALAIFLIITALIAWGHLCESCYGFLRPF